EVVPACEWRQDDLAIKAVQALAFTRWKQGRYREALERFHELEGWFGKNAALCENIGHTYAAIGAYDEAELYFSDAMALTKALPQGVEPDYVHLMHVSTTDKEPPCEVAPAVVNAAFVEAGSKAIL
ncbi:unnamed protein product, partial [Prorocentrum cordatum]